MGEDERRLAELGYKQDLHRSWSGFSNFAISFSIISILAGCFTNFGAGFNNGGPISISWTWPILGAFILLIGFTMSELVSAYPTSGGIYWWASKLGGAKAGFFTGWLNLIGLVAVTAGVSYGCATFIDLTVSTYSESYADDYSLTRVFLIFLGVLILDLGAEHLQQPPDGDRQQRLGVVARGGRFRDRADPHFVPDQHQSFSYVFTERFNNSGYSDGSTSSVAFWFAVLPFGFLLTQYTITGFDACAHLSEETSSASMAAAKGIWRSIFYSLLGGYILLLCVVFAIPNGRRGTRQRRRRCRWGRLHLHVVARQGLGDVGAVHLGISPGLLRDLVHDVGLADDVRLQPRRRDPGVADLAEAHGEACPGECGDARCDLLRDRHGACAHRGQRRDTGRAIDPPRRLLRRHVHRGHRALPGVRHPDLAALAAR